MTEPIVNPQPATDGHVPNPSTGGAATPAWRHTSTKPLQAALRGTGHKHIGPAARLWPFGQESDTAARAGRYPPDTSRHRQRSRAALAAYVIAKYTRPGQVVFGGFVGSGTTMVEAVYAGSHAVSRNENAAATLASVKPPTRLLEATVRDAGQQDIAQAATLWPLGHHTDVAIRAGRHLPDTGLRPQRSQVTQAADVIGASSLMLDAPTTVAFVGRLLAAACYLIEPTASSKAAGGGAARQLIERMVHWTRPFAGPVDDAKPHIVTHCGPGVHRRSVPSAGTPRRGFSADESEPR